MSSCAWLLKFYSFRRRTAQLLRSDSAGALHADSTAGRLWASRRALAKQNFTFNSMQLACFGRCCCLPLVFKLTAILKAVEASPLKPYSIHF